MSIRIDSAAGTPAGLVSQRKWIYHLHQVDVKALQCRGRQKVTRPVGKLSCISHLPSVRNLLGPTHQWKRRGGHPQHSDRSHSWEPHLANPVDFFDKSRTLDLHIPFLLCCLGIVVIRHIEGISQQIDISSL